MSTDQRDDGFFSSLFDFSFTSFITTKLIKVLYVLALIAVGVWALALLIAGLSRGGAAAFFSIVGAVLGFFFGVIYVRVLLELIIVVFRVGENTATMARALGGQAWPGGGAPPAAPPAQPYRAPDPTPPPTPQPSPGWEPPPAPRAEADDPTRRLPDERGEAPRPGPGDVPPPPPA